MSCRRHLADVACWLLALGTLLAAGAGRTLAEAPRCPPLAEQRCALRGSGHNNVNEYTFVIDGLNLLLEYTDSGYFKLTCPENLTLDNTALPRFELPLGVKKVHLKYCPAPRSSYAAVLDAFNVRVLDKLTLYQTDEVTRAQLAGLTSVHTLELEDVRRLAEDALAATPHLLHLSLQNVTMQPGALRQLPPALQKLDLILMNTNVPADVLDAVPGLINVMVRDSYNVSVAMGRHVQTLALDLPAARVPTALPPALRSLAVFGWDERRPAAWEACARLHKLHVRYTSVEALPADWVRACSSLQVLHVEFSARLRELHPAVLRGTSQLQELHVTYGALTSLPTGLLDDTGNLTVLNLTGNRLQVLPGGLFAKTQRLQKLVLAHNRLSGSVYSSLRAVTSLRELDLSHNELRDSCGRADDTVRGVSPLEGLIMLTHLNLRKTNISVICRDWRDRMPLLQELDLSQNNFTSVTFADLQFPGSAAVKVILDENNVTRLLYTRDDYLRARTADRSRAVVTMEDTLACDCDAYWAARALRETDQLHVRARCAAGDMLRDIDLQQLTCAAPALCARTSCTCAWTHRPGRPARDLHVRCERRHVAHVRDVTAPLQAALQADGQSSDDYAWHLNLEQNNISRLDVKELPKYLSVLDLSNNSLSTLDDAALALLDGRRTVRLAGNPLDCSCRHAAVLRALHALPHDTLTCAGGAPLTAAHLQDCSSGPGAGVAAAGAVLVTLLAAAALAGLLLHPALRLRLKAALHRKGWLPAAPEDDAGRRYDVFVSFSHGDERFVRDVLVARLEAPPDGLRLCLHYRDWAPGGWIPAQIAASVRASRRTVAVVSAHFLRSAWARAEFQEAHALALRDARPRLVVVLLDEPAALPLDDRLRRYLQTNTYVRWGDPFFWQKLRLALPRGPGLQAPGVARPAPPVPALQEPGAPLQEPGASLQEPGASLQEPGLDVPAARVQPTEEVLATPAPAILAEEVQAVDLQAPPPPASCTRTSSSCQSSSSCGPSPASSSLELDRLMSSCGAQYGAASPHYAVVSV